MGASPHAPDSCGAPSPSFGLRRDDSFVGWLTDGWHQEALDGLGFLVALRYTGDVVSMALGGQTRGLVYLAKGDLEVSVDLDVLVGWPGASLAIVGQATHGSSPSEELVGDLQTVSNIDAPGAFRLHEALLRQDFGPWVALAVGVLDLNAQFDVIDTASLFVNSSHGIGAEYAQSGHNGPSIFPATALAASLRLAPVQATYVQVGVFDGVPGDPADPTATVVQLQRGDGALLAAEAGLLWPDGEAPIGKLALGSWVFTGRFVDVGADPEAPLEHAGNYGIYALAEWTVAHWAGTHSLALFGRVGMADELVNAIGAYFGGGAVLTGVAPWLETDRLGLGVARAQMGSPWQRAERATGAAAAAHETTVELTYYAAVTGWFEVQPDFQLVFNPGAVVASVPGLVCILRFAVAL